MPTALTKTLVAKKIAKIVVGHSVSGVTITVLHNNCPVEKTHQKVQLYIGAAVIGALVAEKAEAWTDKQIDNIVDAWKSLKSEDTTSA
jgi:hypothetical protein